MSTEAPPSTSSASPLRERLALAHVALLVIASSWLLGGIGTRLEWIFAALASPALFLLASEALARRRARDRDGLFRILRWTALLFLLGLFVLISALNPSHRPAFLYNTYVLRPVPHVEWLPASARPLESLRIFACLGGLACAGLALVFCVQSRKALRTLVTALVLNAVALAVLGTLQNQTGATGPGFGIVHANNPTWFATFLYHNHWGAFAVLAVAAALGLVFHSLREPPERGWLHGPGPLLTLAALVVAATAPLTSSRSTTLLMAGLGVLAALLATRRLARAKHRPALAFIPIIALLALAAGVFLQSGDTIAGRVAKTFDQITDMREGSVNYPRDQLYADTWRMAAAKPAYGWGLESYGPVFLKFTTFRPGPDGLHPIHLDAHSDWLQALAEIGFVGTALLLLLGLIPLAETLRTQRRLDALPAWLLGGCALVAAYAWVEFPFANPSVVALWWALFFCALRLARLNPAATRPAPRVAT